MLYPGKPGVPTACGRDADRHLAKPARALVAHGVRTVARLASFSLFELTRYFPGDEVRQHLVVHIEHIVGAKQTAGDSVARNGYHSLDSAEMHGAVDGTAFERDGRRVRSKNPGARVVYLHSPVNDVTRAVNFFGAKDELRGSVRSEPAVDRGAACDQYAARVDLHTARDVGSAKDA